MSEAPTATISQERPMAASVISMAQEVDKSCVCPICSQRFAWPITMVDHVVVVHGPVIVDANEFSADLVFLGADGIFWRLTCESCTYGVEKRKERLDAHERVDLLYPLLTTRRVVCDGFTTTIIGGGC